MAMKRRMKDGPRNSITSLAVKVQAWQTPGTDSFRSRGGDRKDEPGLDQQARTWPTPPTNDSKDDAPPSQYERNTPPLNVEAVKWESPTASNNANRTTTLSPAELEGTHGLRLAGQASDWMSGSHLRPTTETDGQPSSASDLTSRPRLNPDFTDWLMNLVPGWTSILPLDLTAYGQPETQLSSDKQPTHLPNYARTWEYEDAV